MLTQIGIISHTTDTDTDTHTQNLPIISVVRRRSSRGTMDDMRMRSWTGEGLMHVHLEGVGLKARPLTLKLTIDSGYQTESFMSPTMLKMLSKG